VETLIEQRSDLARARAFWALTKPRQTALLLCTGVCSYALSQGLPFEALEGFTMAAALFLSISGCTALNMVLDRDVDAVMERTVNRPLPTGAVEVAEAQAFGGTVSLLGLALAFGLDARFGLAVAAGFVIDLFLYTAWLKRLTPFSIVVGGVSGGMPVLAGRVLALGYIDPTALLLSASVVLWIPAHVLTLASSRVKEYQRAGVPTWPGAYGPRATRLFIAGSNLLNTVTLTTAGLVLRIRSVALALLLAASLAMCILSTIQLAAPTARRNQLIFRAASLYMLCSCLLLTVGSLV
jgi:protoheme IX farnesyltransferase